MRTEVIDAAKALGLLHKLTPYGFRGLTSEERQQLQDYLRDLRE